MASGIKNDHGTIQDSYLLVNKNKCGQQNDHVEITKMVMEQSAIISLMFILRGLRF
jgi:hypothetical protein